MTEAKEPGPQVVDARGQPVERLRVGYPCTNPACLAPAKSVQNKFGGGLVCIACGYEEK